MNLVVLAVLSAGATATPSSEAGKLCASAGMSWLFFSGEEGYDPTAIFDATVAYDFAAGSNVELTLGYGRLADLDSSALISVPVMVSLRLGQEWVFRGRSGRYYALLSGGVIMHSYKLSSHDEEKFENAFGYGDWDYTVDSAPAWCLGGGVEFYSATNAKMYLSLDLSYMWHEAEAEHDIDDVKTSETLALDAVVLRMGLTYQF